jgi:aspartyl-tRNA(Asn)/glutamyl-tRNA(Gln) amidotransferase subunit B
MGIEYEEVIGLEVHVQLITQSKAFSRSRCAFGEMPNTATDPVVMGLPGALPVINYEAICQTVRAGLMFHCEIAKTCHWDRKNYFYPDSPKNYQISQQGRPICRGGYVEIELPGPSRNVMGKHRNVKLNRIHLEEDVGKLNHCGDYSLIDFNRAGTPLMEIVSEPDLHSADEVAAYLKAIRMSLKSADVSNCDMEKGQMRCDVNISLRPVGSQKLGLRTELKNINSISDACNAIHYEIDRQRAILENGGQLCQETRRWDAQLGASKGMRSKENTPDYCYFPEPDLMPVELSQEIIQNLEKNLPEQPFDRQWRFMKQYELPYTITSVLCFDFHLGNFFEEAVSHHYNPRGIANLIINDLSREITQSGGTVKDSPISPKELAKLVQMTDNGEISKQAAQDALAEMFRSGDDAQCVVQRMKLTQKQDLGELEEICRGVIQKNKKAVEEFLAGKENAINALKGQVMRESAGKANPAVVDATIRQLLGH